MLRTLFQIFAVVVVAVANLLIGGPIELSCTLDNATGERNDLGEHPDAVIDKPSLQARRSDPVYKKNLQRLIERNRMFEDKRNEPRS
jgi:hypothetical protein